MAGVNLLAKLLSHTPDLQTIVVKADEPWKEGPELIDGADGVLLFVGKAPNGGNSMRRDWRRCERLAARAADCRPCIGPSARRSSIHRRLRQTLRRMSWRPRPEVQSPQRSREPVAGGHPILNGIAPFEVEDEFYYALKFAKPAGSIKPLLQVSIDNEHQTVAWSWERPDGGRSFGFSACHFHRNWELPQYRRLAAQAFCGRWAARSPLME